VKCQIVCVYDSFRVDGGYEANTLRHVDVWWRNSYNITLSNETVPVHILLMPLRSMVTTVHVICFNSFICINT